MPTQWDVARAANTMGVVTTVHIDPTKISKIIKNKLIRWLKDGYLEGGYRSEARKLGDMLVDKFELDSVKYTWRGISVVSPTPELRGKLLELLDADWAAYILEHPEANRGWYMDNYRTSRKQLANGSREVYMNFHNKEFRRAAAGLINDFCNPDRGKKVKEVVDALNGTEPIHIYN